MAADVDGQSGHGLSRPPGYAAQVKAGKIDGKAVPAHSRTRAGMVQIDAKGGFAYPALDLAIDALPGLALEAGVAAAGTHSSHHIGQAGRTAERHLRSAQGRDVLTAHKAAVMGMNVSSFDPFVPREDPAWLDA